MTLTLILLILSTLLISSTHIWSAIKSGCFYGKGTEQNKLQKFIKNLHFVQTPFWYSLFGAFWILLFIIFSYQHPFVLNTEIDNNALFIDLIGSYFITHGTSALCGTFYQGFINWGSNLPFIDKNEKKQFELANPFNNKTIWVKKLWYGYNRIWFSIVGLFMVILGLLIFIHK